MPAAAFCALVNAPASIIARNDCTDCPVENSNINNPTEAILLLTCFAPQTALSLRILVGFST